METEKIKQLIPDFLEKKTVKSEKISRVPKNGKFFKIRNFTP